MSDPREDFVQDPGLGWTMAALFACDRCQEPQHFFVSHGGRLLCSDCWQAIGSPWPRREATPQEIALAEQRTREQMKARGGADKYRVMAGKS